MPSTEDITMNVLNGNNIIRHSDGNYYFGTHSYSSLIKNKGDKYVFRILCFLKIIKKEIDLYYKNFPKKIKNYEDLYYVVSQLYDSEKFIYDNPIIKPFVDKI